MRPRFHHSLRLLPLLPLLACAPPDVAVYPLAEFAVFQRHNVTSDLISAPRGIGLDLARFGWQLRVERGSDAYLEQRHDVGRLAFFAAEAEIQEVALEAGPIGDPGETPLRVSAELNGRELPAIAMGAGWGAHRIALPSGAVRAGWNFLKLRGRPSDGQDLSGGIVLRRARFRSAPGRFRPDRTRAIELRQEAAQAGDRSTISMPAASYLDAVLELPAGARFETGLAARLAEPGSKEAIVARLSVLSAGGEQGPLGEVRLEDGGAARMTADLSAWAGQLVRLRLSVGGPGVGVVEWRGAAVHGRGPPAPDPLAPQPSLPAPATGRLGRPDLLVVLLDTARADAFSCYGSEHPTPAADRLAGGGTRFAHAVAPAPWTGQSVPSLLTGLYPDSLGVGAFGSALPAGVTTLAETLTAAGYRTYLWSQHPFYRSPGDLLRGFEEAEFAAEGDHRTLPSPDRLTADDRPTFAFVHLMPPHLPYDPPPPFRGALTSWYEGEVEVTASYLNSFPNRRDPGELSDDDRRYIRERYLEHAAFADSMLGDLLAALDARGRYDDALVVLLSDHGEAFLEHGFFLHGRRLYREYLEVPLIVKWPAAVAGHRPVVEAPVSLVDLVPTLVDGLGLDSPEPGFQGRTLLPGALDGAAQPERPIYALTRGSGDASRTPNTRLMLQSGRWKAIFDPLAEAVELYDLEADPGEQRDLAAESPLQALLWRQRILRQSAIDEELLVQTGASPQERELDPDTIRQLKALGYL